MTFHFAHMAPPGAARSLPTPVHAPGRGLAARWVRCPLTQRLVMHWDRPAIPVQHASLSPAPQPALPSLLDLRAA